jgi:hypothetical protein
MEISGEMVGQQTEAEMICGCIKSGTTYVCKSNNDLLGMMWEQMSQDREHRKEYIKQAYQDRKQRIPDRKENIPKLQKYRQEAKGEQK